MKLLAPFLLIATYTNNTLALASSSSGADTVPERCRVTNWLDLEDEIKHFNGIVNATQDSSFVRKLIKKLDPITLDEPLFLGSTIESFFSYKYQVDVKVQHLAIRGISNVYAKPIGVASSDRLVASVHVGTDLIADFDLTVQLTQLTPATGCRENEEAFFGLCFAKCALLTHGSHPKRIAGNTCATDRCDDVTQDTIAGGCFPKCLDKYTSAIGSAVCSGDCALLFGPEYRNRGLFCQRGNVHLRPRPSYVRLMERPVIASKKLGTLCTGFGVNGEGQCPTRYLNVCLTETREEDNDGNCDPMSIRMAGQVELQKPHAAVKAKLIVLECQGKLADNAAACKNLSANEFMQSLFTGKTQAFLEKAYKRIQELQLVSASLDFQDMQVRQLQVVLGNTQLPDTLIEWLLRIVKTQLIQPPPTGLIQKAVGEKVARIALNVASDGVRRHLAPHFGSTCLDDDNTR